MLFRHRGRIFIVAHAAIFYDLHLSFIAYIFTPRQLLKDTCTLSVLHRKKISQLTTICGVDAFAISFVACRVHAGTTWETQRVWQSVWLYIQNACNGQPAMLSCSSKRNSMPFLLTLSIHCDWLKAIACVIAGIPQGCNMKSTAVSLPLV